MNDFTYDTYNTATRAGKLRVEKLKELVATTLRLANVFCEDIIAISPRVVMHTDVAYISYNKHDAHLKISFRLPNGHSLLPRWQEVEIVVGLMQREGYTLNRKNIDAGGDVHLEFFRPIVS